jgi:predicted nucleotidyltransferase
MPYTGDMPRVEPPMPKLVRRLPSGRVPRAAIRRYVDQVVAKFHPEKVILFGSHAYGRPNSDSDVDLLVVMPAYDMTNQAIRIDRAVDAPFPLDLLVRTPQYLAKRISWNDWFLREVVEKGIVLYEAADARMVPKGRSRPSRRPARIRGEPDVP